MKIRLSLYQDYMRNFINFYIINEKLALFTLTVFFIKNLYEEFLIFPPNYYIGVNI
jgi:hypothetical protein